MNKKQCQKCGEENPPEAVMCWACYTPLTGGGAAAAERTPAKEDAPRKAIPMWQIGVVGLALVVGIGMGVKTLLPSGEAVPDLTTTPAPPPKSGDSGAPSPGAPQVLPPGVVSPVPLPQPPAIVPRQNETLLTVEVPPNPRVDEAVMGIVPTEQNITEYKAASLALLAHRKIVNAKRWRRMQVYVFSDQQAATMFRNYQKKRRGAPLDTEDYQSLVALWQRTPVVYEFYGRYERWASPTKRPDDWWNHWPAWSPQSM